MPARNFLETVVLQMLRASMMNKSETSPVEALVRKNNQ
jgi:hypothetical protein